MARTFAAATTDRVSWSGGTSALSATDVSIMCWFKRSTVPTTGQSPGIWTTYADFNKLAQVYLELTTGKVTVLWRSTTITTAQSAARWDDGAWHRLLVVRRATSPYTQIYVDGVSEGSQTADPLTDATAPLNQEWGRNGGDADSSSFGGSLARCALIVGTAITPEEADAFLWWGRRARAYTQWLEMGMATTEPDWSGSGLSGTLTATTVGDHAPCGVPFGADDAWDAREFTAASFKAAWALNRNVVLQPRRVSL